MSKVKLIAAGRSVRAQHGVVCSFPDDFLGISVGRLLRKHEVGYCSLPHRDCATTTCAPLAALSFVAARTRGSRGLVHRWSMTAHWTTGTPVCSALGGDKLLLT